MDEIARLRIVCVADRRRSAAALAIRGRLERVAHSDLGRALDRHVGSDASVRVDRLTVRLEVDPDAYDDRTLAVLWADRIRDALLAAGALAPSPEPIRAGRGASVSDDRAADRAAPDGPEPLMLELSRRAMRGDHDSITALARAIFADPSAVPRRLRLALSPGERRVLLRLMEGGPADGAPLGRRTAAPSQGGPRRGISGARRSSAPQPRTRRSWAAELTAASRRWLAATSPGASVGHGPRAAAAPAVAPLLRRRGDRSPAPDPRLASRVAGIALLWPWLTVPLETAADRLRRLDPVEARRLALAALIPSRLGAVDDPVVRLLAGDDLAADASVIVVSEDELVLAADGADAVLAAFAAALPGFGGSTPDFVRREFIVRAGVVDAAVDPVSVRVAALPLDPVLSRLTYPIGLFRLPWSRPIALHLEHR